MKLSTRWTLLALPLVLLACGDSGDAGTEENTGLGDTTDDTAAVQAPMSDTMASTGTGSAMANTVTLQPLSNSGVSGEATLSEQGGQVQVMARLTGAQANQSHPGHIHQGTCQSLGPVVVALQPITADASGSGTSTSTVSQSLSTLIDGNHVVNYHAPDGTPISCGQITGHSM